MPFHTIVCQKNLRQGIAFRERKRAPRRRVAVAVSVLHLSIARQSASYLSMKPRRSVTLPLDDRTIFVHMTSGAVIRLRPSELIGWIVSDLKPKRRNLIDLSRQLKATPSNQLARSRRPD